jgi:hypothetical protein
MEIRIPIFGPTYTNRSLDIGAQVTRNFYPEVNAATQEPTALMPFPGLSLFCATGDGVNRGLGVHNDELYSVTGTTLYKVSSGGTATSLGTIPGSGRCVLESDGSNLVIATGTTKPYVYNGSTLTLTTDADLHTSSSVTYINQRVVYDGADGDIIFADLTDPTSVASENITKAESDPDGVDFVWAFKQQVFVAGKNTIQPYWNSGSGNPPYEAILNSVQQLGVHAKYSIANDKEYTYFLASDLNIYQFEGLSVRPIGNPAICQEISKYSDSSDAIGMCFSFDSQDFYLLTFPTGDATWLYQVNTGIWTNLAYGTDGGQHLINAYKFIYNKHIVADRRNGNIYQLDFDTYTDNGDVIQRQRDTIAINSRNLGTGRPGADITMNWLRLIVEPGVSLVSGAANIIMQFSDDNGKSWSSEMWETLDQQGEYHHIVEWPQLGTFKSRMFRFRMSDPVKWVLIDAIADIEVNID